MTRSPSPLLARVLDADLDPLLVGAIAITPSKCSSLPGAAKL